MREIDIDGGKKKRKNKREEEERQLVFVSHVAGRLL